MERSWCVGNGQTQGLRLQEMCGALNCMHDEQIVLLEDMKEYIVRRLSTLECTRLQGFPDHWVDIGEWIDSKGKKHKDSSSPKYKALGNSIALPFGISF